MTTGETIEAGMIGLEGMVGLPALFGDEKSGQHLLVQAPGTALRMTAIDVSPRSIRALRFAACLCATWCAAQRRNANRRLQQSAFSTATHTARWLLMMHDRLQSDAMPLTHEFLSTMLGVRRTRVTEAARWCNERGLIRYARGVVGIIDHPGLSAVACECYRNHDRLLN